MNPTIALSSCWCSGRHLDGYEMIQEVVDLGFEYIELSHGIRIVLVEGILKAVEEGLIKVSSLHNFCPLPIHVTAPAPNLYEPTADDVREREQWHRYTRRTLDFATTVGAGRVILHSGSVRFFWNPLPALERCSEGRSPEDLCNDARYQKTLAKTLSRIHRKAPKYMERLRQSFQEVVEYAKDKNIKLCIENREGILEMPMDGDMAGFLENFPETDTIGYWHDAGHAQIKQQMGVIGHEQLLKENSKRQFGFHLHDVSADGHDHQPIGSGTIDYNMIKSYIRPEHLLVIELSPRLTTEQVIASRDFLLKLVED